jgi:hypothetical protein
VDCSQCAPHGYGHARLCEQAPVFFALIAKDVAFGCDDERGRHACQLRQGSLQWAGSRVPAFICIGNVLLPKPLHQRSVKKESLTEFGVTRSVEIAVSDRVEQSLQTNVRATALSCRAGASDESIAPFQSLGIEVIRV